MLMSLGKIDKAPSIGGSFCPRVFSYLFYYADMRIDKRQHDYESCIKIKIIFNINKKKLYLGVLSQNCHSD